MERGGAAGERVYKLTGKAFSIGQNGATPQFGTIFDRLTVYPSPYMVLTNEGYTKHYYAGTERIATVIGTDSLPIIPKSLGKQHAAEIFDGFEKQASGIASFNPKRTQKNENIKLEPLDELQYKEGGLEEIHLFKEDSNNVNLTSLFKEWQAVREKNKDKEQQKDEDSEVTIFFTHSDHLGSASWITDKNGEPIQYMHYAPYGELLANQNWWGYDERFKFTGKERDWESGYDYFGARYYDNRKGFWNSVDPLADKYPNVTPYLYCGGNPIKYIDPDGREKYNFLSPNEDQNLYNASDNYKDNVPTIHIWAHGQKNKIVFSSNNGSVTCTNAKELVSFLEDNVFNQSDAWQKHLDDNTQAVIVLHSCYSGNKDGSIAQELSSLLENTVVIAPNAFVGVNPDTQIEIGSIRAVPTGEKNDQKRPLYALKGYSLWNVFRDGKIITNFIGSSKPNVSNPATYQIQD